MRGKQRLRFRGSVASRAEASAHLHAAGDAVLVERGRPRLLVVSCPCGCGEQFPINLDPRAGAAWQFYRTARTGISVFPSVWRESGCKSHYIIWRDTIWLFGRNEEDLDEVEETELDKLAQTVLQRLSTSRLTPFAEIAESLGAVPWDVLSACRRLVRSGQAREGVSKERGTFVKTSH